MNLLPLACLFASVAICCCQTTGAIPPVEVVQATPADLPSVRSIQALTAAPGHHFVGYYGITPWDSAGTRLFCLESTFGDRLVGADDHASVCLIDPTTRALTRIAETAAWNLQQGAMLHWLPTAPDRELIYNDRIDGRLVSVMLDVQTKQRRRVIDRSVAAVAPDGKTAIGLNYDRLRRIRPVTGYAGGDATVPLISRPADDGLYLVDLATGASRLLLSVAACIELAAPPADLTDQTFWLEHPLFSRSGRRLFLMARAFDPKSRRIVSLPLVMRADGTGLRALAPWAIQGASHFDWLDDRRLVLTREHAPNHWRHLLFDTEAPDVAPKVLAPDVLTRDGHCSFSPDGRWMITDTYPDADRRQHLFILDVVANRAARIASFHAPEQYRGDWRCDLHPRWSRDSKQLCIDSVHDGVRQVYLIDLAMPAPN